MADPFGLGAVDHSDRTLQSDLVQCLALSFLTLQGQEEIRWTDAMKQSLPAAGHSRSHSLSFRRSVPIGGGRHGAGVSAESYQEGVVSKPFSGELPQIPLPR